MRKPQAFPEHCSLCPGAPAAPTRCEAWYSCLREGQARTVNEPTYVPSRNRAGTTPPMPGGPCPSMGGTASSHGHPRGVRRPYQQLMGPNPQGGRAVGCRVRGWATGDVAALPGEHQRDSRHSPGDMSALQCARNAGTTAPSFRGMAACRAVRIRVLRGVPTPLHCSWTNPRCSCLGSALGGEASWQVCQEHIHPEGMPCPSPGRVWTLAPGAAAPAPRLIGRSQSPSESGVDRPHDSACHPETGANPEAKATQRPSHLHCPRETLPWEVARDYDPLEAASVPHPEVGGPRGVA